MHLIFNATRLPYAEYATYLLGASKSANLVLAFTPNALNTLLLIDKSRLKGKVSIMRYFSRLFNLPIYESRSPSSTASIDKYLDNFNKSCLEDIESGSKFYLCDSFSLADILLWDYCKSVPSSSLSSLVLKYLQDLEKAHPILIDAASEINSCLANSSVMDLFKAKIALKVSELFPDVLSPESTLVLPKDHKKTDLALPVAKLRLPGNPIEIAKNMASKFDKSDYIEGCEAVGPYVNFTFNKQLFASLLIPQIIRLDKAYGSNFQGAGKTAIIEFSSPNIAKPFHAGHLRSTIIGNFITNVLKFTGWKTHSINYLGDWGKQYGLLALGYQRYGDRKSLENDPIKHLFDVYVKINAAGDELNENGESPVHNEARAYFKRMEDGDVEAIKLWKEFRDLSIEKYKQIYDRLNVAFDIYSGESQYSLTQMQSVLNELKDLGLLVPCDGAQVVDLKPQGLGTAVIGKSDGSMLYLSRDIAAAIERHEQFQFDKMFYVVANQQDHHFKQLFKILELMGKEWSSKCEHINFGMIKGMATRKGNVVFLEDMLNQTKDEMHAVMQKTADKYAQIENPTEVANCVGLSSIMVQDMSARRNKDYEFNWSRMLSFEGDTGPYIQYSHSRLRSIERMTDFQLDMSKFDASLLVEPQVHLLLVLLSKYPDIVLEVANTLEPSNIVQYCFELCHAFSITYEHLYVKGREFQLANARLALYTCTRITLGNAMRLLGLRPLERM